MYVAGHTNTADAYNNITLRAYALGTGRLFLTQHVSRDNDGGEEIGEIVSQDGKVFVASQSGTAASGVGGEAFAVRAFKAKDGIILWQDFHNVEGELVDGANDIAIKGNKVYVAGSTETAAGGSAMTTRVYRAKTGTLVWENNFNSAGNPDDVANAIAVSGNQVFVAGYRRPALGTDVTFSVRAYKHR